MNYLFSAEEDIVQVARWQAHKDQITCVTFVPELNLVASCSFDYHVYMWCKETCKRIGSLVLGTGTSINGHSDAERKKQDKIWQIKIDKRPRHFADRKEAQNLIEECEEMDYATMFNKGKALESKEVDKEIEKVLKNEEEAAAQLQKHLEEDLK